MNPLDGRIDGKKENDQTWQMGPAQGAAKNPKQILASNRARNTSDAANEAMSVGNPEVKQAVSRINRDSGVKASLSQEAARGMLDSVKRERQSSVGDDSPETGKERRVRRNAIQANEVGQVSSSFKAADRVHRFQKALELSEGKLKSLENEVGKNLVNQDVSGLEEQIKQVKKDIAGLKDFLKKQ